MSWRLNSYELVSNLHRASWFLLLASMSLVGYAAGISYVKTLKETRQQWLDSKKAWIISHVLLPFFRAVDGTKYGNEVLTKVMISVIFIGLIVVALIARAYALLRR